MIGLDTKYSKVQINYETISDFFKTHRHIETSAKISDAVHCHPGFYNHHGDLIDIHNFIGILEFQIQNLKVQNIEIKDPYGNEFICDKEAHVVIEKFLKDHIENENSKFHRYIKKWNYNLTRTVYHVGNSTHAEISFVCKEGYHVKQHHELHLRTHVHVKKNGLMHFHDRMLACECSPESCAQNVSSYIHGINAKIVNPSLKHSLEKTVCSKNAGGAVFSFSFGEILVDDVLCLNHKKELEDDIKVEKCVLVNKPKCIFIEKTEKKKSDMIFHGVVFTLSSLLIGIWFL